MTTELLKEEGRRLMIQGDYQEAAKVFREYLNTERDDIEARYLYTAAKELKEPIKVNINFIAVIGLDIYLHMGVTAPLGFTLSDVMNDVTEKQRSGLQIDSGFQKMENL